MMDRDSSDIVNGIVIQPTVYGPDPMKASLLVTYKEKRGRSIGDVGPHLPVPVYNPGQRIGPVTSNISSQAYLYVGC